MRAALFLIALAALALAPFAAPWLQFVLTLAIAKGFAALGVAVLLRGGLISIGHAMFYAVSAYAIAFLARAGLNEFVLLLVLGTAASAVAGLVVGAFMVRYRAIFFAMLNLAMSMVLYALLSKLYGITGGTDGMRLAVPSFFGVKLDKPSFDFALYYAGLVLMVGVGYGVQRYLASPLGHALSAVHTNELRLEYLGVPVRIVLLIAYTLSAALAGIGGAIAAMAIGHILPEFAFWTASGHLVLVAVLGGIGGVAGPFIGSLFLEVLHTVAVGVTDAWNLIIGVALIGVIFFLPSGLYGLLRRRRGEPA
ncbi:ABC-type branched-chain amino acid transport system, permease component [Hyphomicrobiales bacterium]|nr:ABC-type branched-chain amino acid transport system, permease component [Hyphomicrobiales bacterium]CAH1701497.1 ABC-type branched-chain amino acid transport system, permease component [Hyphomicrobiales bacterium]CAI0345454.1 ABC-type branched-chain amino acid transport system, permease component [Hyphomicrobiales bacterium]